MNFFRFERFEKSSNTIEIRLGLEVLLIQFYNQIKLARFPATRNSVSYPIPRNLSYHLMDVLTKKSESKYPPHILTPSLLNFFGQSNPGFNISKKPTQSTNIITAKPHHHMLRKSTKLKLFDNYDMDSDWSDDMPQKPNKRSSIPKSKKYIFYPKNPIKPIEETKSPHWSRFWVGGTK